MPLIIFLPVYACLVCVRVAGVKGNTFVMLCWGYLKPQMRIIHKHTYGHTKAHTGHRKVKRDIMRTSVWNWTWQVRKTSLNIFFRYSKKIITREWTHVWLWNWTNKGVEISSLKKNFPTGEVYTEVISWAKQYIWSLILGQREVKPTIPSHFARQERINLREEVQMGFVWWFHWNCQFTQGHME